MNKFEKACIICGLIGILVYQPTYIKLENGNFADIMLIISFILKDLVFGAMIILPLYFHFWRKK